MPVCDDNATALTIDQTIDIVCATLCVCLSVLAVCQSLSVYLFVCDFLPASVSMYAISIQDTVLEVIKLALLSRRLRNYTLIQLVAGSTAWLLQKRDSV